MYTLRLHAVSDRSLELHQLFVALLVASSAVPLTPHTGTISCPLTAGDPNSLPASEQL